MRRTKRVTPNTEGSEDARGPLTVSARTVYRHRWSLIALAGILVLLVGLFGRSLTDELSAGSDDSASTSALAYDVHTRGPAPIPPSERLLQTVSAEPWFKVAIRSNRHTLLTPPSWRLTRPLEPVAQPGFVMAQICRKTWGLRCFPTSDGQDCRACAA